jgi:hypothetical protein
MEDGHGANREMGGWQMSENMQCQTCRHYQMPTQTCAAFPGIHADASGNLVDGLEIPEEIWSGDFDHRLPHKDDNGIRFEAKPDFANIWAEIPIGNDAE